MAIQNIKANKTASLTDLRDPMKVIEAAGNDTVAIMNRNQLVGYFVPAARAEVNFSYVTDEEFDKILPEVLEEEKEVLDYLKDK
jgi:antitoxin StbD